MRGVVVMSVFVWGASSGLAAADPPAVIAVQSVHTPSEAAGSTPWKVLMPTADSWCEANAGVGPGEPMTIVLAAPAAIATVEVDPDGSPFNAIDRVEVTADGAKFTGTRAAPVAGAIGRPPPIAIHLAGTPVTQLVVRVIASAKGSNGGNCVSSIGLDTTAPATVLYGVSAAAAAAVWPSIGAIQAALTSCDAKSLKAQVAFPFTDNWYIMTNDGMKERSKKYKTAATFAKDCKAKLHKEADQMKPGSARVEMTKPAALDVHGDGKVWQLELDGDHWRLRSFYMG